MPTQGYSPTQHDSNGPCICQNDQVKFQRKSHSGQTPGPVIISKGNQVRFYRLLIRLTP